MVTLPTHHPSIQVGSTYNPVSTVSFLPPRAAPCFLVFKLLVSIKHHSVSLSIHPSMENYSHQSYPDSGESSPLSREIDCENPASWDEPPSSAAANYKVKFMCSYGGKIQPRSHDNQLSYVGGDTKILSIERNAPFPAFLSKLASICDASASDICFKYQLPDEDLDALISVTNDEDLEHMMLEYDRLKRSFPKPARLRIFLFTAASNSNPEEYHHHFNKEAPKPEGSWFVDALNSAQHRSSPPPPPPPNPELSPPDFLFGLDKAAPIINNSKVPDQAVGEPANFIQTQMERFRIGEGEMHKSYQELNNNSPTMYQTEYYSKVQESAPLAPPQGVPVPISAGYWPERGQVVASGIPADQQHQQQPVYVVQHHAGGAYHQNPSVRPIPGAGQAYYSVPRAVAETYREQHAAVPPQPSSLIQQHAVAGGMQEGMGMVRQPPMVSTEQGYAQVSYVDSSGRPVYYTMAGGGLPPPPPPPQYHMMTTAAAAGVDGRAVGGVGMGLDAKAVAGKPPPTSSV